MSILRKSSHLTSFAALLMVAAPAGAVTVLNEPFDNDNGFIKAENDESMDGVDFFSEAADNYWGIYDLSGVNSDFNGDPQPAGVPNYTNFTGTYLVGEDVNHPGDTHNIPLMLVWNNLDVAGLTDLAFSGKFAANDPGSFDGSDGLVIQYRFDSDAIDGLDPYFAILRFSPDGDAGDNDELALDADFDGTGEGTTLTQMAQTFTAAIPGSGTTLDLRILMSSSNSGESFAVDDFVVTAVAAVPEASSLAFGALLGGVAGLASCIGRRRARRQAA